MRTELRVTKYNPQFRDEGGAYQKDEWTDFSDIGKKFEDGILTISEYLLVEQRYIDAAKSFLDLLRIKEIVITSLEKYHSNDEIDSILLSTYRKVNNGVTFEIKDIDDLIRLNLRGLLWCKVVSPDATAEIIFGYDYYMYFTTEEDCKEKLIPVVNKIGLFAD